MAGKLLTKKMHDFLEKQEFLYVGTCGAGGRPLVAPKFLVKVEDDHIYLADFVIGRIWTNLRRNPRVSLAAMNMETLVGYQISGAAHMFGRGKEHLRLVKELQEKEVTLSARRVMEGIVRGKKHKSFEASFPDRVIIFKVKVKEVVRIEPSGTVERKTRPGIFLQVHAGGSGRVRR